MHGELVLRVDELQRRQRLDAEGSLPVGMRSVSTQASPVRELLDLARLRAVVGQLMPHVDRLVGVVVVPDDREVGGHRRTVMPTRFARQRHLSLLASKVDGPFDRSSRPEEFGDRPWRSL